MNRFLAALSLMSLPLAAGCASLYGYPGDTGGYYGDDDDAYYGDEYARRSPLDATLYESQGGLRVSLNRRAHVAIFEIEPGRGVGLLYPGYAGERSIFNAGYSRVSFSAPRPYAWYLDGDPLGHYRRNPRYFLLVASRYPLRLSNIHGNHGSMRSMLGYGVYTSLNANRIMNDLVDMVLVPQRDEDWDSDVITMWPNGRGYSRYGHGGGYGDYGWDNDPYYWDRVVRVRCPNGRVYTVPYHRVDTACYGTLDPRRPPRNPNEPPVRGDTTRNDTLGRPGRRRPGSPPPADGEVRGGGIQRPGGVPGGTVDRPRVGETANGPDDVPAINIRRRRFGEIDTRGTTANAGDAGDAGQRPRVTPRSGGGDAGGESAGERPRMTPRPRTPASEGGSTGESVKPTRETPVFRPRPRAEEPSRPAEQPRQEPRSEPRRPSVREEPREEPRRPEVRQEPRSQPRSEPRAEPRREEPRREQPRQEPRSEPRREQPRSEPSSTTRSEPRVSSPPSHSSGERRGRPEDQQ